MVGQEIIISRRAKAWEERGFGVRVEGRISPREAPASSEAGGRRRGCRGVGEFEDARQEAEAAPSRASMFSLRQQVRPSAGGGRGGWQEQAERVLKE